MPIDSETRFSDGWWLRVLFQRLDARNQGSMNGPAELTSRQRPSGFVRPGLRLLRDWYLGRPPLPAAAAGWTSGFGEFIEFSRMNYASLVVDPTRHRMKPLGWRTAAQGDDLGDALALQISRANDLAVAFSDCAKDSLSLGDGYMVVGGPPPGERFPLVTAESPLQVITAEDVQSRRTLAGLKVTVDEWTGAHLAFLYLPGRVRVAVENRPASTVGISALTDAAFGAGWDWDEAASGPLPDGMGTVVPVVRFPNRDGVGDFEPHLPTLARINNTILDRVVIGKLQAFRQRAVKNLPQTSDGQPAAADGSNVIDYSDVFSADPGAMWQVPEGVEFWESQVADLTGIRGAIKDDVQALAAATHTPLHLITPDAAAGSAEGASLLREEHVFKVEDRRERAQGRLAKVMALCFLAMGERERADVSQIETLWQPAERYSLTEKASAASQLKGILPFEAIATDILQYPPDAVVRLSAQRSADLLFQDLADAAAAAGSAAAATQVSSAGVPAGDGG